MPVKDKQWDHYRLDVMDRGSNRWRLYDRRGQADRISVLDLRARELLALSPHLKATRTVFVTTSGPPVAKSCHFLPGVSDKDWDRDLRGFC